MAGTRVVLTYHDYAALPDDGRRYELHEGGLSVTPAPGTLHQRVSIRLVSALHAHVTASHLGEVFHAPYDVILSDTSVVQPDIVYVAPDRKEIVTARGAEGAPTLVIEILSRSTTAIDRQTKMRLYARHGVPYYWIVDPDARKVEVYVLRAEGYELRVQVSEDEALHAEPFADLTIPTGSLWT